MKSSLLRKRTALRSEIAALHFVKSMSNLQDRGSDFSLELTRVRVI